MSKGTPPAISDDTPERIRIRKAQEQLSEVELKTVTLVSSHSFKYENQKTVGTEG